MKIIGSLLIFLLAFLAVFMTMSSFGVTYDEFHYFHSSDLQFEWLGRLVQGLSTGKADQTLSDPIIQEYWRWQPFLVPHPPLSRLLSGITHHLFYPAVDLFSSYRLAAALLFSMTASLLFFWAFELFGLSTAWVCGLLWILMPHAFGQAHIGSTDIPLTFFWLAASYAFYKGTEKWVWSIVFALLLGLAFSIKFPAFLLPIPLVAWALIYKKRGAFQNLAVMSILSPLVMFVTQPYLWTNPIGRTFEFFHQSLTRMRIPAARIPTYFFGQQLLGNELPFYYPFFITAISIPIGILLLMAVGPFFASQNQGQKEIRTLAGIQILFILLVPVLPGSFIHDGVRLLLPAFPFILLLSGAGFFYIQQGLFRFFEQKPIQENKSSKKIIPQRIANPFNGIRLLKLDRKKVAVPVGLALLVLLPTTWEMIDIHPHQLMYYNPLVGGVKGAYRLGLETTYLGEAFNQDFLQYLNRMLPARSGVNASYASKTFWNYQKYGTLRKDLTISLRDFNYYILLNRRGYLIFFDQWLIKNKTPMATWSFKGVPLIFIYNFNYQDVCSWKDKGISLKSLYEIEFGKDFSIGP